MAPEIRKGFNKQMEGIFVQATEESLGDQSESAVYFDEIYFVKANRSWGMTFIPFFTKPENWHIGTPQRPENITDEYQARLFTAVYGSTIAITPDKERAGTHLHIPEESLVEIKERLGNSVSEAELQEEHSIQPLPWIFFIDEVYYNLAVSEVKSILVRNFHTGVMSNRVRTPVLFELFQILTDSGVLREWQAVRMREALQKIL